VGDSWNEIKKLTSAVATMNYIRGLEGSVVVVDRIKVEGSHRWVPLGFTPLY
jgi:hypothetical protein